MKFKAIKNSVLAASALATLGLSGCFTKPYMRDEIAKRVAMPAFMTDRQIAIDPFVITTWERMHERNAPATIYIEGDGLNWVSPKSKSLDPTPPNPVALHLAAHDLSENVAYLARPCQFTKLTDVTKPCDSAYWTNKRYAPEVIDTMSKALDDIKAQYGIDGFHLVGYSGGGAVAAILAAKRDDVLSLRTVAGNLDHEVHSNYHEVSPLTGSLNAVDFVGNLRDVPQHHYIGGQDEIVPPAILQSYLQTLGETNCVSYTFVQEAGHDEGWVEKWPELLKETAACSGPIQPADTGFIAADPKFMERPPADKP